MNKERIFSVLRFLLSAVGAYLLGTSVMGTTVDESFIQTAIGVVMGLASVIWSVMDKSTTVEALQGALRQSLTFIGGLFVASGKLKAESLELILGLAAALIPFLYAGLSRGKTQALDNGKIKIKDLKQ